MLKNKLMRAAEIETCLRDGLDFLTQHHYLFSEFTITESPASGTFYIIVYISDSYRKKINISFFPKHGFINASLVDTENNFTFADAGSMAFKVPGFENAHIKSLDQIEIFLRLLRKELETQYLPLVQGGVFSKDAFDWSPYK